FSSAGPPEGKRDLVTVSINRPLPRQISGAGPRHLDPALAPTDLVADRLGIFALRFEYQPRAVGRVPAIVVGLPVDGRASDWRRSIWWLSISHALPCTHPNRRIFKSIRRTRRFVYPIVYPRAIFRHYPGAPNFSDIPMASA